jgi:hypothetical protein
MAVVTQSQVRKAEAHYAAAARPATAVAPAAAARQQPSPDVINVGYVAAR